MHVHTHTYSDTILYNTLQKRKLRLRKEICKLPQLELEPGLPGRTARVPFWAPLKRLGFITQKKISRRHSAAALGSERKHFPNSFRSPALALVPGDT